MRKHQKLSLTLVIITVFVALLIFLPELISAGSLEPSAPPDSTMKTLDQIPPTWSQIIPGSERFELVMGGAAVLDKETGLVWEQSPDTTSITWPIACDHCNRREVANRKGWRLPTIEELASLVDNDNSNPALPTGHPFSNVQPFFYWSSSTCMSIGFAFGVYFSDGAVLGYDKYDASKTAFWWCVRGGHGYDAY